MGIDWDTVKDDEVINLSFSGICKNFRDDVSTSHALLKLYAVKFIVEKLNFDDITMEYDYRLSNNKRIRADVFGVKNDHKVIIECGGIDRDKIKNIHDYFILESQLNRLYIIPYGYKEPFLYKKGMRICKLCGHQL